MRFLRIDHCAPWLLKRKVTIIIQQQAAGYKHCILCVTVWYGKPKLFSTIVHTNWFNDFARPPAHLKLHSGWLVPINVIITNKATNSNDSVRPWDTRPQAARTLQVHIFELGPNANKRKDFNGYEFIVSCSSTGDEMWNVPTCVLKTILGFPTKI